MPVPLSANSDVCDAIRVSVTYGILVGVTGMPRCMFDLSFRQRTLRIHRDPMTMMSTDFFTRRKALLNATALAAALLYGNAAQALPVIPGAAGFGIETPAGRGGTVHKVTNLNESGSGSLGACVAASGPRVCVFEVSGTIRLTKDLKVKNPNITIAGQTAPSPGIMLRGAGLWIMTSDVLVQHLRVRPGDDPDGPPPDNRGALIIDGTADKPVGNIVIDHSSFQWGIDENASAYWNWRTITFSNNIFAEALNDSLHPKGPHGYGVLFGGRNTGSVSLVGNLMAHQADRNPLSLAPTFVFVNNVVYNRKYYEVDLQGGNLPSENSIVGNVFIRGKDYANTKVKPLRVGGYTLPLLNGSSVYVADNAVDGATSDPWSVVTITTLQEALPILRLGKKPAWPKNLVARPTANNNVLDHVLASVGARPADRDPVDARIVREVRDGKGQLVNCVAADGSARCARNAGGWPVLAQNKRTLTLPADPNKVNADGYTNLEKWLHQMAADVERGEAAKPAGKLIAAPRAVLD